MSHESGMKGGNVHDISAQIDAPFHVGIPQFKTLLCTPFTGLDRFQTGVRRSARRSELGNRINF